MRKKLGLFLLMALLLLLSACSKNGKLYEENMEKADKSIEANEYEEALTYVKEALSLIEDDEVALAYEAQLNHFIDSKTFYHDGEFTEAIELLELVLAEDNGSDLLVTRAKEEQDNMTVLQMEMADYEAKLADSMALIDDKQFEEAQNLLRSLEEIYIEHSSFSILTKKRDKWDKEVVRLIEVEEEKEAERQRKEAEEKKQKEEEEKQKKQIGNFAGYYLADDNFACHITETYLHCALPESDYIIDNTIDEIVENKGNEVKVIIGGNTVIWYLKNDNQTFVSGEEEMRRVTKDEANAVFGGYYELR